MPQDDVKPCPHCGGTGELRGETLADKIERARHVVMTPAMQEEQRQSWARSEMGMLNEEYKTFTPPLRLSCFHIATGAHGHTEYYDDLREARLAASRWSKESRGRWTYTITDANGNVIPNTTGCGICNDPNCDNPSGKH